MEGTNARDYGGKSITEKALEFVKVTDGESKRVAKEQKTPLSSDMKALQLIGDIGFVGVDAGGDVGRSIGKLIDVGAKRAGAKDGIHAQGAFKQVGRFLGSLVSFYLLPVGILGLGLLIAKASKKPAEFSVGSPSNFQPTQQPTNNPPSLLNPTSSATASTETMPKKIITEEEKINAEKQILLSSVKKKGWKHPDEIYDAIIFFTNAVKGSGKLAEGMFRVSGSKNEEDRYITELKNKKEIKPLIDINSNCAFIKRLIKELDKRLLLGNLDKNQLLVLLADGKKSNELKITEIRSIMVELGKNEPKQLQAIANLFNLLHYLGAPPYEITKMSYENLVIVMGPNLFPPPEVQTMEEAMKPLPENAIAKFFMENSQDIFKGLVES